MSGTIGEAWADYYSNLLKDLSPSEVQTEETRRAFYAGAASMFDLVLKAADLPTEDQGAQIMAALHRELDDYARNFRKRFKA